MSVRHETKFQWAIDTGHKIHIRRSENDLMEDASKEGYNDDNTVIVFASEYTESQAKSISEKVLVKIKNNTFKILNEKWKEYDDEQD